MRAIRITGLVAAWLALPLCAAAQDQQPWFNPDLPLEQRINALIGQMTLTEKASQMVNQARAIPRLGMPAYNWWSEALHGVARNGYATVFPEPVGLAATFDTARIKQMGVAIGTEARVKFNMAGGPVRTTASPRGWISGRPTSTSSATRVGVVARRPMAKTRS
jgi:beta-glucosidase